MRKLLRFAFLFMLLRLAFSVGAASSNKNYLQDNLIRFHVVANSDSAEDQALKLKVRDAVTDYLGDKMAVLTDRNQAVSFLNQQLVKIQGVAEQVLRSAGCADSVQVTLGQEAYDTRLYDSFTLPAGIYESLKIMIGEGSGQNWWCVVFPSLCVGASSAEFEDAAVSAGFTEGLTETLEGEPGYRIRFFFMDLLGKLEIMFSKP